jgi:hypothetical protein
MFLPSVFAILCNQQLIAALGLTEPSALLGRLYASIDALVQAIDSYYESYRRVFGWRQRGKKEKPEKAADLRHANNHELVSASLLPFSDSFWTSSAIVDSSASLFGCSSSSL